MSAIKDLEHDGTEFFDTQFPNRKVVTKQKIELEKKTTEVEDATKIRMQEEWMSLNNPALWQGTMEPDDF